MIIIKPNNFVAGIHDHMPVILEEKQFDAWLDDDAIPTSLLRMLKPAGERVAEAAGAVIVGVGLFLITQAAGLG